MKTSFFVFLLITLNNLLYGQYKLTPKFAIECTNVKNQQRTGTCWSFATSSFLESEVKRLKNIDVDLSEMFSVRTTYIDKAQNYILRQGKANFSEGSLSHDVINAVPQSLRDGSYALGATKSETIIKVILPSALPGIIGSFLLAISRAIGETMIVVMAASLQANLTINPLEPATTITTQIVTALTGDTEFDNPKTLVAFALGLTLFFITLFLNYFALKIVKKYREIYD